MRFPFVTRSSHEQYVADTEEYIELLWKDIESYLGQIGQLSGKLLEYDAEARQVALRAEEVKSTRAMVIGALNQASGYLDGVRMLVEAHDPARADEDPNG